MNGNQIAGLWLLNTAIPLFTILVAWRLGWLAWLWAFAVEYVRDGQPEQRTREEYAHDLDDRTITEAVAAVPELDLDEGPQPVDWERLNQLRGTRAVERGDLEDWYDEHNDADLTQPFAAEFHDGAPEVAVPTVVLGDGSYAGLSGTIPTDVPRPGQPVGKGENWCDSSAAAGNRELAPLAAGPGYLPFRPHAGPPAWRPRHAKTSWVDELITEALGAPTVEHYMWNWQQRRALTT